MDDYTVVERVLLSATEVLGEVIPGVDMRFDGLFAMSSRIAHACDMMSIEEFAEHLSYLRLSLAMFPFDTHDARRH